MRPQEIDLVPQEFRRQQRLQKHLRVFLFVFTGLALTVLSGKFLLSHFLSKEKAIIKQLEAEEISILAQQKTLGALNSRISFLQSRIDALEILRGGPPVERLLQLLSQAINEAAWLTQVTFVRAGEKSKAPPEKTTTGYFVVAPANSEKEAEKPWNEQMRLELRGEALNHSNLAEFAKALLQSPEVENVHILDTKTKNYTFGQAVEYNLAVVLRVRK